MMLAASCVRICFSWLCREGRVASGQNLIEYGLLAALVSLVAVGAVTAVGGAVNTSLWEPVAASF